MCRVRRQWVTRGRLAINDGKHSQQRISLGFWGELPRLPDASDFLVHKHRGQALDLRLVDDQLCIGAVKQIIPPAVLAGQQQGARRQPRLRRVRRRLGQDVDPVGPSRLLGQGQVRLVVKIQMFPGQLVDPQPGQPQQMKKNDKQQEMWAAVRAGVIECFRFGQEFGDFPPLPRQILGVQAVWVQ